MARTTVSKNKNGQYQVTIPQAIGDAHNLAGKKVEWEQGTATNKLVMVIRDE